MRILELTGAAALALALALSPALASEATTLKSSEGGGLIQEGAEPIPFALQELGGGEVQLSDHLGDKAVLLAFWSLFCGPCREELPVLDQLGKKYADQGLEVFAINLDGEKRAKPVEAYMKSNDFGFRVLWEEMEGARYITADPYGVAGTPTVVLIGKDGKVTWSHVGRSAAPVVEQHIQDALGTAH